MNLFCKFGWHRWAGSWMRSFVTGKSHPYLYCLRGCGLEQVYEGFSNRTSGWFDRCYCDKESDPHSVARFHHPDYVR